MGFQLPNVAMVISRLRIYKFQVLTIIVVCVFLFIWNDDKTNLSGLTMSTLPRWNLINRNTSSPNSRTDGKPLQFFKQVRHKPVFFLSAVVNKDRPNKGDTNVMVSAMDGARIPLTCCMIINGNQLYSTPAQIFSKHHHTDVFPDFFEYFNPVQFAAKQFLCVLPGMQRVTNISLTSSRCSDDVVDYIPVIYTQPVPGGLAICAKVAFEKGPVPERFIEWVEIQRLLGVDKILLFAINLPERLNQVFRYYQNKGILEIVQYELPGVIEGVPLRGMTMDTQLHPQFSHDESLPVLECRERLAGYTYVAGIDMDEVILPHRKETLKEFMKAYLKEYPSASAFFFHAQFHVTGWGKYAPHDNIFFFEYLKATKPRWECEKYIYLPERTGAVATHKTSARSGFKTVILPPEHAIIHHYRVCPHVWKSCFPPVIVDKQMLRFSNILQDRVAMVHKHLGWKESNRTIV